MASTNLIPWEINEATEGIQKCFKNMILRLRNQDNALIIARFILSAKNEINLSDNYRRDLINNLTSLSKFYDNKPFSEMTREDIQGFLNRFRMPEEKDPLHKWIGTYNHYLVVISKFFKWLYCPDLPSSEREKQTKKPSVIDNLTQLKRKEKSNLQTN